jgi:hypothetical protein
VRLVVHRVDDCRAVGLEPVAERERRVIQVLGDDTHAADGQRPLDKIAIADRRRQLLEPDRKVRMLHLRRQDGFEPLAQAARRIEIPCAARGEHRGEKRKALDVIPVRVGDHEVTAHGLLGLGHQRLPETMSHGDAVQDDQGSVVRPRLDAGRIAAIAQGSRSRGRQ